MHKQLRNLCPVVLAAVVSVVSANADTVKSDYSHQADFAHFHTYSWGNVKTANPLYADRVKQAVNESLQAKGWQLVPKWRGYYCLREW